MVPTLLQIVVVIGFVTQANGQGIPRPNVPEKIKAPAGEEVVLYVRASGSQIYTCQQGPDGTYSWTLKAPEAELLDQQGSVVGRHYAGPTWKHNDGSEVSGKVVAKVDSPDSDSIPWLLVSATSHSGEGVFGRVASIQRIHTHGGQPPPAADCSASKQNTETKSSYTAEYFFFAPAKQGGTADMVPGGVPAGQGDVVGGVASSSPPLLPKLAIPHAHSGFPSCVAGGKAEHVQGVVLLGVSVDQERQCLQGRNGKRAALAGTGGHRSGQAMEVQAVPAKPDTGRDRVDGEDQLHACCIELILGAKGGLEPPMGFPASS